MSRQPRAGRRRGRPLAVALLGGMMLAAATPPPTATPATSRNPTVRLGRGYTLLDPSLTLPPLFALAPDLISLAPALVDTPPAPGDGDAALAWDLSYRHARLGGLANADLRTDPATGFSRQLDTDVLSLGMSWPLAGNRVGLAYQLQSARGGHGDEPGLTRFLPSSEGATHALSVGVTHEFGAGLPPPAPPLLLPPESMPSATPPTATVAARTPSSVP